MTPIEHLNSLAAHGAQIGCSTITRSSDGNWIDTVFKAMPDEKFYLAQLDFLNNHPWIRALTFDLYLPDVDEVLALAIWKDGHIDSGSKEAVLFSSFVQQF